MSSHCQVLRVLGTKGRDLPLRGHVGLECLPDQLAKKCVKRGFDFNILCIGETGIGKSTLIDSLFKANFHDVPATHKQPKVTLSEHTYELQESSVHLRLRVVSTAGYGDQINTENSCRAMLEHIDRQFESYLQEELKVKRDMIRFHDTRIHACLFLLSPTGLPIKTLDLACMKELHKKVNIIPVIAKADTISRSELPQFKARIIEELQSNGVQIYQFPTDDETVADINARMNDQLPFAVVGSQEEIVVRGRRVRARQYPWGILEIENDAHCDFIKLKEMLLCTNMEDLREKTHTTHYEVYRRNRLLEMRVLKQLQESGQLQQFEQLHGPVAEDNLLKEFELLQRQIAEENQQLDDERKQLEEQKRQLEDKKRQLEEGIKKKAVQGEATATQALRGEDDLETRMGSNFNRGIQPVH